MRTPISFEAHLRCNAGLHSCTQMERRALRRAARTGLDDPRARLQPAQAGAAKQEDPPAEAAPAEGEGRRGGGAKGPQVEIKISDASGKVVRTIKADAKRGLNRVVWDLGRDEFRMPPNPNRGGFQGSTERSHAGLLWHQWLGTALQAMGVTKTEYEADGVGGYPNIKYSSDSFTGVGADKAYPTAVWNAATEMLPFLRKA